MRLRSFAPLLASLALVALPAAAAADVELTGSSPEAGAELDEAPDDVVLGFDGELDVDGSGFTVTDAAGSVVGRGEVDLDVAERNELRGSVEIAQPGRYTVSWEVLGADGHQVTGELSFTVRGDEAQEAGVANTAMPQRVRVAPLTLGGLLLVAAAGATALWRARRAAWPARRSPLGRSLAVMFAVLVLAGCVTENRPDAETCAQPSVRVEAALTDGGALEPENVAVCRGQQLVLEIDSQRDGVLHIHGYDDQAQEVRAGETVTFEFTVDRTGEFPIELHMQEETEGTTVGILTVHEP